MFIAPQDIVHEAKNITFSRRAGYATVVKRRATRRIGELMAELKAADKLATGTKGDISNLMPGGVSETPPEARALTLAERGVDKNLADKARKLAAGRPISLTH